ncbi:phosphatidylinositol mannoside acyltransferase [Nocardioidaceae bacterium]|nr:phosphatidylinositol mannoside acyltransferase [Nocardioidaceae bacterium]
MARGVAGPWREELSASAYVAGWRLVRRLPERRARQLFDRIGRRLYRGDGKSVQRLRANLRRLDVSEADLERVVETGVRSYLRYWCESFRLPSWPVDDVVARTRRVDEQRVRDALARGGVVAVLPHAGNWDWAGTWACQEVAPLVSVAERLKPERLYDEFVAFRESLGMQILPLGEADTWPRLRTWVAEGGLACLLADRDLSRHAVTVQLAGHAARFPSGPAQLALETGAALLPITSHYEGEQMCLVFHPEIPPSDPQTMTQGVADAFTSALRAHPEDWHMMQRVFVDDLDPTRAG